MDTKLAAALTAPCVSTSAASETPDEALPSRYWKAFRTTNEPGHDMEDAATGCLSLTSATIRDRGRRERASRSYPHGLLCGRYVGLGRRTVWRVSGPLDCLARDVGD